MIVRVPNALLYAAFVLVLFPAAAQQPTGSPPLGVNLGSSSRVPYIAGLAGEGEGYGRARPRRALAAQRSMGGMRKSQGSKSRAGHGSMGNMPMNGSMPGMDHGSMGNMPMSQGTGGRR